MISHSYWLSPDETRLITEHLVRFKEDNPQHHLNNVITDVLLEIGSFEARGTAEPQKLKTLRSAANIDKNKLPLYLSEEERKLILSLVPLPIESLKELT